MLVARQLPCPRLDAKARIFKFVLRLVAQKSRRWNLDASSEEELQRLQPPVLNVTHTPFFSFRSDRRVGRAEAEVHVQWVFGGGQPSAN